MCPTRAGLKDSPKERPCVRSLLNNRNENHKNKGFSIQKLPFKKEPVGGSNANPKECRVALNAKEEKPLDYTGGMGWTHWRKITVLG